MSQIGAMLQWVLVDGDLHHVSDFAHLPVGQRPKALCPICQSQVKLRLGNIRVHHCAHLPNVECAATQPETAIHLNTKLHIYWELKKSQQVNVIEMCSYKKHSLYSRCQNTRECLWLEKWDDVKVECVIGSRRPDIALFLNGTVIGAIEVFVTHEVDETKANYLQELGIPWLEVIGDEDFYTGESVWTVDRPLFAYRIEPNNWVCDECQKKIYSQEYSRNNYSKVIAAKIVDFFYPNGKKYRALYLVAEVIKDGQPLEIRLQDGKGAILAKGSTPPSDSSKVALNEAFEKELERRKRTGAIVDSPMRWDREWLPLYSNDEILIYSDDRYPRRYVWWNKEQKWFIPKDRKNISWDRMAKDDTNF